MGFWDLFSKPYRPLRLQAQEAEDIVPVSALLQDAITRHEGLSLDQKASTFQMKFNRFCYELDTKQPKRAPCVLQIHGVLKAQFMGIRPNDTLNLLHIEARALEAPSYSLDFVFSHPDRESGLSKNLRLEVECLDLLLLDLSAPYRVSSVPLH